MERRKRTPDYSLHHCTRILVWRRAKRAAYRQHGTLRLENIGRSYVHIFARESIMSGAVFPNKIRYSSRVNIYWSVHRRLATKFSFPELIRIRPKPKFRADWRRARISVVSSSWATIAPRISERKVNQNRCRVWPEKPMWLLQHICCTFDVKNKQIDMSTLHVYFGRT